MDRHLLDLVISTVYSSSPTAREQGIGYISEVTCHGRAFEQTNKACAMHEVGLGRGLVLRTRVALANVTLFSHTSAGLLGTWNH